MEIAVARCITAKRVYLDLPRRNRVVQVTEQDIGDRLRSDNVSRHSKCHARLIDEVIGTRPGIISVCPCAPARGLVGAGIVHITNEIATAVKGQVGAR